MTHSLHFCLHNRTIQHTTTFALCCFRKVWIITWCSYWIIMTTGVSSKAHNHEVIIAAPNYHVVSAYDGACVWLMSDRFGLAMFDLTESSTPLMITPKPLPLTVCVSVCVRAAVKTVWRAGFHRSFSFPFSTGWSLQSQLPNKWNVSIELNPSSPTSTKTIKPLLFAVPLQPSRRSPCVCVSSFTRLTPLLSERKSPGKFWWETLCQSDENRRLSLSALNEHFTLSVAYVVHALWAFCMSSPININMIHHRGSVEGSQAE